MQALPKTILMYSTCVDILKTEKAKLQAIFGDSCVCIDCSTFDRSAFLSQKNQ